MQNNNDFIEYSEALKDKLSKEFHCGNNSLDNFLRENNSLDKKYGKTYVYLDDSKERIIAYFNITTGAVIQTCNDINNNCGGSIHINCFALDSKYHHMCVVNKKEIYLSDVLLVKCMDTIFKIREEHVGFSFITLYSTIEGYNMYIRNGFLEAEEDMDIPKTSSETQCTPMYFPITDI